MASAAEWGQSAATTTISPPQHPNAAGCLQMCASISHDRDRRWRWWAGNTSLDKQNHSSRQGLLCTRSKHVLIMSPCLQLILTLCSPLCDWNLAQSQCWKAGGTSATKGNGAASRLEGRVRKRWMGYREELKPSLLGRGKKGSQVSKLKDTKQITPCWEGPRRSGFSCAIFHNLFTSKMLTGRFTDSRQYSVSSLHLLMAGIGLLLLLRIVVVVVGSAPPFRRNPTPWCGKTAQIEMPPLQKCLTPGTWSSHQVHSSTVFVWTVQLDSTRTQISNNRMLFTLVAL